MKRILTLIILCFALFSFCSTANAGSFLPRYVSSINYCGLGVYLAPKETVIYSEPDEDSQVTNIIRWSNLGVRSEHGDLTSGNTFVAFLPEKNIAAFAVSDEEDDYYQVVYNQKTGATGWVKKTSSDNFYTWAQFFKKYGKDKGIYLFADIPDKYKTIYTGPGDDSQTLDKQYTWPYQVEYKFIRGNWMLVKFVDFDKTTSIGWIRWRDNDGKIFAFPDLDTRDF